MVVATVDTSRRMLHGTNCVVYIRYYENASTQTKLLGAVKDAEVKKYINTETLSRIGNRGVPHIVSPKKREVIGTLKKLVVNQMFQNLPFINMITAVDKTSMRGGFGDILTNEPERTFDLLIIGYVDDVMTTTNIVGCKVTRIERKFKHDDFVIDELGFKAYDFYETQQQT